MYHVWDQDGARGGDSKAPFVFLLTREGIQERLYGGGRLEQRHTDA